VYFRSPKRKNLRLHCISKRHWSKPR
jgi:hypothetical protein